MARKVIVELVDDFDGTSKAEETVSFSLDGVLYEIDLSAKNARKLRDSLEKWIPHARKAGRVKKGTVTVTAARTAADREQTQAIRDWARQNGFEVSSRGRVSSEIVEAYKKATA
ncbi:histone-like nucleoid-structuring protein Lsr2 [Nocardia puris]|uniref:Lsr2 protein n=1 Tax=Nocardia puris TaxID=208602 RepID=A0A366CV36_9NOCA|nr:Lsr2 family protein [Nocardia puris]RBO79532.1 Lsr2 protein [Nocardia puris]